MDNQNTNVRKRREGRREDGKDGARGAGRVGHSKGTEGDRGHHEEARVVTAVFAVDFKLLSVITDGLALVGTTNKDALFCKLENNTGVRIVHRAALRV